jgi:hypothetical protein
VRRFQFRGFVSLLLSFAFLVAVVTGLVLWLAPPGKAGPGLLLGIGKGVWKHMHIYVSLLMLIAGFVHLWLNWSLYANYLWQRTTGRLHLKKELAGALAITVAVVAISSLGGQSDARLLALSPQQIAQRASKPVDQIVSLLKKEGIEVSDPADSFLEIAQRNKVSPGAVMAVIQRCVPESLRPGTAAPR